MAKPSLASAARIIASPRAWGTAVAATVAVTVGIGAAPSTPEVDAVANGRSFARANCAGCHNVTADDGEPYLGPRFQALGDRLSQNELLARFARVSAHGVGKMPPIAISEEQAQDLTAYLRALRDRQF